MDSRKTVADHEAGSTLSMYNMALQYSAVTENNEISCKIPVDRLEGFEPGELQRVAMLLDKAADTALEQYREERKEVAYHEAGHAVVNHFLSREISPLRSVTIVPEMSWSYALGHYVCFGAGRLSPIFEGIKALIDKEILKQEHEARVNEPLSDSDFDRLVRILIERTIAGEVAQSFYTGKLRRRAEEITEAKRLIRKYIGRTREHVIEHFNNLVAETHNLLVEHWDALILVVEQLLQRKTLSGTEVTALIESI